MATKRSTACEVSRCPRQARRWTTSVRFWLFLLLALSSGSVLIRLHHIDEAFTSENWIVSLVPDRQSVTCGLLTAIPRAFTGPHIRGQEGGSARPGPEERERVRSRQEEEKVEAAREAKGRRVDSPSVRLIVVSCLRDLIINYRHHRKSLPNRLCLA